MSSTRVRKCSRPRSRSSPSTLSSLRAGSRGRERPRSCRGGTPAARATSKPSPAPPTRTKRAAPEVGARRPCLWGTWELRRLDDIFPGDDSVQWSQQLSVKRSTTFYFQLSTTTANATNKIQIKVISTKCEVQQVGRWKPIKCSSSKAFRSSQSTDERGLTQRANSSPRRGRIRGSLRRSKRRPHWTTSTSSFTS